MINNNKQRKTTNNKNNKWQTMTNDKWPLSTNANDHPDWPTIWIDQPFANDHQDGMTSCKWLSGWTGLLQIIIWINLPLAYDHPDRPTSCKWSFGSTGVLQMIFWINHVYVWKYQEENMMSFFVKWDKWRALPKAPRTLRLCALTEASSWVIQQDSALK